MTPPIKLTGEAAAFWKRHAERLTDAGVLTPADADSFAVLSLTWGMICALSHTEPGADSYREMVQFANLLKQFQSYAKKFGLTPSDRKQTKLNSDGKKKGAGEFGF